MKSKEQLREQYAPLSEKYPWCGALAIAKSERGKEKKSLRIAMRSLGATVAPRYELSGQMLSRPSMESIIDRFMERGEYKVVADDTTPENMEWETADTEKNNEDFVSEQLAEIYVAQGLLEQAKETYRKLSLLYPKKSIYFAELIEKLNEDNNN